MKLPPAPKNAPSATSPAPYEPLASFEGFAPLEGVERRARWLAGSGGAALGANDPPYLALIDRRAAAPRNALAYRKLGNSAGTDALGVQGVDAGENG